MEGFGNVRVHLDVELLLGRQLFIAALDLQLDPASKGFTANCEGEIDEPLARHLVHVTVFWEIVGDFRVFPSCLKYALNAEILVLRDVEHLDVVTFDAARLSEVNTETYYLRFPMTRSLRK